MKYPAQKRYYEKNKDKIAISMHSYYLKNKAKILDYHKNWYANHKLCVLKKRVCPHCGLNLTGTGKKYCKEYAKEMTRINHLKAQVKYLKREGKSR